MMCSSADDERRKIEQTCGCIKSYIGQNLQNTHHHTRSVVTSNSCTLTKAKPTTPKEKPAQYAVRRAKDVDDIVAGESTTTTKVPVLCVECKKFECWGPIHSVILPSNMCLHIPLHCMWLWRERCSDGHHRTLGASSTHCTLIFNALKGKCLKGNMAFFSHFFQLLLINVALRMNEIFGVLQNWTCIKFGFDLLLRVLFWIVIIMKSVMKCLSCLAKSTYLNLG